MKKIIRLGLLFMLCAGLLSGCAGKTDADTGTVFIDKKGKIISVDVESLDKDYYDEGELESYIKELIESYTDKNGDTVELSSFHVKDEVAKLKMEYDSYEDYAKFNGIEFYAGTVLGAQAEGYDFGVEFYSVSDGEDGAKAAKKEDVLKDDDNKVVIIRANLDVQVPGDILFVSKQDTEVTGKRAVSIKGEGANEEAALTYIIYK